MTNWEKTFRAMKPTKTPTHVFEFGAILHADDLNAVNAFFHSTPAKTPEARKLQSDWAAWWISVGDPDNYWLSVPQSVWDEARNRRLAFNLANATTAAEKERVTEVATQGVSTEQARGESERRDPTTGQIFVPPAPVFPSWVKPVAFGAACVVVGFTVVAPLLKKLVLPL
jgi:hypothetical protein